MGANHSSDADDSSGAKNAAGTRPAEMKTCYYVLLGIERQASDEQVRKAYYKKALELHPDRNYGNVEEMTRLFAEVQSAYAVLSDPQERAWYDSHRNAILRGRSELSEDHFEHNIRMTTTEDILEIFTQFDGRMDFSDASSDFYRVSIDTFNNLAREEELACKWDDLDLVSYPEFGLAGDDYETVVRPFYVAWAGFATRKSFSWKEIHRYSAAPDRRTRRLMERENKRLRDEAIYEYNDSVRSLVAFLKKRDPRFKPNFQSEADRQKTLRKAAMAQAARSRAANQAIYYQPEEMAEWMKVKESAEDDAVEEIQDVIREQVECVACKKIFKSEKQYETHERSKKHLKAIKHICWEMENDVKDHQLQEDHSDGLSQINVHDITRICDQVVLSEDYHSASKGHGLLARPTEFKELQNDLEYPQDNAEKPINKYSRSPSIDDDCSTKRKDVDRFLYESDPTSKGHAKVSDIDDITKRVATETIGEYSEHSTQPKVGKAKERRAKKASQQTTTNAKSGTNFVCVTCQAGFSSKTRLFIHIKDLGHAQPMPKSTKDRKGEKK